MADRYQDRAYSAASDYDRDGRAQSPADNESDPLAELARLIGQTDPFGAKPMSRANLQAQPPARPADPSPTYDNYEDSRAVRGSRSGVAVLDAARGRQARASAATAAG